MPPPARREPRQLEAPAPALRLTDDLLADILIRLPTLADLGRASAACPTFRRVIADHSFLHRLRALHPPPLLGTL
uniref:F-box domain-containing protein n=1 Tax=Arundo donax TaxID=35708 RepID=A0A0A9BTU0_ARUDO